MGKSHRILHKKCSPGFVTAAAYEEEEPLPQPTRDPNSRPGDKLRRVAAFANAASSRAQPAPQTQPIPNKWSLRELIDLLSEEYE